MLLPTLALGFLTNSPRCPWMCLIHRYLKNIDCLSFVVCLLQAPHFLAFFLFFFLWPLTVLMEQTRQAVCAVKQSILLRCLWSIYYICLCYQHWTKLCTHFHLGLFCHSLVDKTWLKNDHYVIVRGFVNTPPPSQTKEFVEMLLNLITCQVTINRLIRAAEP